MRGGAGSLARAIRLLTVLPLPGGPPDADVPAGRATVWFPVVGALVGGLLWLVLQSPVPAAVAAAATLLVWAAVGGALHEDALADTADALFVPGDRARRRQVLADPRVGAFGATALVTVLLLRFALLLEMPPAGVLAAPVVGRWAMALTLARAPSLRAEGLGAAYGEGAGSLVPTLVAAALLAALALGAVGTDAFGATPAGSVGAAPGGVWGPPARIAAAWALGAAAGWGAARLVVRRLGGLNGDGHGAAGYLAETAALLPFVVGA